MAKGLEVKGSAGAPQNHSASHVGGGDGGAEEEEEKELGGQPAAQKLDPRVPL